MKVADKSQQVETQTRRLFVLGLRQAGVTYQQIAKSTIQKFGAENLPAGFDSRYAYKDVLRELRKLQALNEGITSEIRQLELQRLDVLLLGIWRQARDGNQGAIDRVLRIMKRRADLLGLDAPTSVDLTLDLSRLTNRQLEQLAEGEDPSHVVATPSPSRT